MKFTVALCFCLITLLSFSQGEYIIEVNPVTGSFVQPISPINGVTYVAGYVSTYDEVRGLYIFPSASPGKLVSVKSNDSIYYNPAVTSLNEFQYDNSAGKLYGLQNPSSGQFVFGTVNASTAAFSQIGSGAVPGLTSLAQGMSTFDKTNQRYLVIGGGNMLFSINATSGSVISNPTLALISGESLLHICYNDADNNLYGLLQNASKTYLVLINIITGAVTKIGSGSTYGFGGGTSTIDKLNSRFIYHYALSGSYYITVLSISTGAVFYNNQIVFAAGGNINSIEYDNVRNKLYAQHWDSTPPTGTKSFAKSETLLFYPNPAKTSITLKSSAEPGKLTIYNVLGEILVEMAVKNQVEEIDISNLPNGIYTIQLNGKSAKLLKE